jgi:hypothetical protein
MMGMRTNDRDRHEDGDRDRDRIDPRIEQGFDLAPALLNLGEDWLRAEQDEQDLLRAEHEILTQQR